MELTVSKKFYFEAAHSLPHLPEGHKCRNIHGHSYRFDVHCTGEIDHRGFVIDYDEISEAVAPIVKQLDHRNLNEVLTNQSTAENLAVWLWNQIQPKLTKLSLITVHETSKTTVTYRPTNQPLH